jgi:hypothetical protein
MPRADIPAWAASAGAEAAQAILDTSFGVPDPVNRKRFRQRSVVYGRREFVPRLLNPSTGSEPSGNVQYFTEQVLCVGPTSPSPEQASCIATLA